MIKIEINKDGAKTVIEREDIQAITALDDMLNILFLAGVDLEEITDAIKQMNKNEQNNHKNDSKDIQNTCSI